MKKRSIITLTLLLSLLLSGCGSTDSEKTENNTGKKQTTVILNEVAHSVFYAPMYAAIEKGYFKEEGIDLELVTGYGADKTMTAVLSGEADIGFMGSESSIYVYNQNPDDSIVNFAQLTQRAGNFLVARTPLENFQWTDLKGTDILGGRKGVVPIYM